MALAVEDLRGSSCRLDILACREVARLRNPPEKLDSAVRLSFIIVLPTGPFSLNSGSSGGSAGECPNQAFFENTARMLAEGFRSFENDRLIHCPSSELKSVRAKLDQPGDTQPRDYLGHFQIPQMDNLHVDTRTQAGGLSCRLEPIIRLSSISSSSHTMRTDLIIDQPPTTPIVVASSNPLPSHVKAR